MEKQLSERKAQHLVRIVHIGFVGVWGAMILTVISTVLMFAFPENGFFEWFFRNIACWIFVAGFIMLMVNKLISYLIPESELQQTPDATNKTSTIKCEEDNYVRLP